MSGLELQMLKIELDETRRHVVFARTAIRNAIDELENGNTDGAIETLRQIVGEEQEPTT